jgi:hypothetical protein
MSAVRQFNPSDASEEEVDRFLFALMGRFEKHYVGQERLLTREKLAEMLDYTPQHVDKLVRMGIIKPFRFYDGADPRFKYSQVLEALR